MGGKVALQVFVNVSAGFGFRGGRERTVGFVDGAVNVRVGKVELVDRCDVFQPVMEPSVRCVEMQRFNGIFRFLNHGIDIVFLLFRVVERSGKDAGHHKRPISFRADERQNILVTFEEKPQVFQLLPFGRNLVAAIHGETQIPQNLGDAANVRNLPPSP